MKKTLLVLSMLLFAVGLNGCGYNSMQVNEEAAVAAWGDVEAAYQRRSDLVPNLVTVVREYAAHEKETITAVTEARARVGRYEQEGTTGDPEALLKFKAAQSEMGSALARLLVVMENYPALKADQNYRALMAQLEGTENRIHISRIRYNDAVFVFNSSIRTFPNSMTNRFLLKLVRKEPYKAEPGADKAHVVAKK